MESLLLWVPYRTYMPSPQPLLRRLLTCGAGEISPLIPGQEDLRQQLRRIAGAGLIFVDQSFFNALHDLDPGPSYQLAHRPGTGLCGEIWEAVLRTSSLRVLGLTYNDLHWLNVPGNPNFCAPDLASFAQHFHAMMWNYEQWGEVADNTLPVQHEPWMEESGPPVANWNTLASAIPARFDGAWALDDREIRRTGRRRYWDTSVVGAHYSTRAMAFRSAGAAGLSIAPFRRLANLTERLVRVRRRLLPRRENLDAVLRRRTMDFVVAHSGASFVCGGGVRYFVRKYLEMAAIGGCMAAWPAGGLRAYGFRDGIHLAECPAPDDFGPVARWLRSRPALREAMGNAAQALVHAEHTLNTRTAQLLAWLRELARGRTCTGRYEEGKFHLRDV